MGRKAFNHPNFHSRLFETLGNRPPTRIVLVVWKRVKFKPNLGAFVPNSSQARDAFVTWTGFWGLFRGKIGFLLSYVFVFVHVLYRLYSLISTCNWTRRDQNNCVAQIYLVLAFPAPRDGFVHFRATCHWCMAGNLGNTSGKNGDDTFRHVITCRLQSVHISNDSAITKHMWKPLWLTLRASKRINVQTLKSPPPTFQMKESTLGKRNPPRSGQITHLE